ADDLTGNAHQGTTGVARIDRGIGLNEVLNAPLRLPGKRQTAALALMIPEVTVKVRFSPSGLPTARTHSPTRASVLLPSGAGVRLFASILRTARSVLGSVPTTF